MAFLVNLECVLVSVIFLICFRANQMGFKKGFDNLFFQAYGCFQGNDSVPHRLRWRLHGGTGGLAPPKPKSRQKLSKKNGIKLEFTFN